MYPENSLISGCFQFGSQNQREIKIKIVGSRIGIILSKEQFLLVKNSFIFYNSYIN